MGEGDFCYVPSLDAAEHILGSDVVRAQKCFRVVMLLGDGQGRGPEKHPGADAP